MQYTNNNNDDDDKNNNNNKRTITIHRNNNDINNNRMKPGGAAFNGTGQLAGKAKQNEKHKALDWLNFEFLSTLPYGQNFVSRIAKGECIEPKIAQEQTQSKKNKIDPIHNKKEIENKNKQQQPKTWQH